MCLAHSSLTRDEIGNLIDLECIEGTDESHAKSRWTWNAGARESWSESMAESIGMMPYKNQLYAHNPAKDLRSSGARALHLEFRRCHEANCTEIHGAGASRHDARVTSILKNDLASNGL